MGWTPLDWSTLAEAGVDQRTSDVSAVIQEIVDRDGRVEGNAVGSPATASPNHTTATTPPPSSTSNTRFPDVHAISAVGSGD